MTATQPHSRSATFLQTDDRASRGQQTRLKLLMVATCVFANKGFKAATTREICEQARSNMAAIHYHFVDKLGLYKAVLMLPVQQFSELANKFDPKQPTLLQIMLTFYGALLGQLRNPDANFGHHMRLHFRELIEPTQIDDRAQEQAFAPFFQGLVQVLCSQLKLQEPDEDTFRLAFAMIGMAMDFYMSSQCPVKFGPDLASTPEKVDVLIDRLSVYACGMVAAERERLQAATAGSMAAAKPIQRRKTEK